MKDDELRERAWSAIGPFFQREQEKVAERFRQLAGTGMASSKLSEIVPASHDGRVEALFVARGRYRWGQYDKDARTVELRGQPGNGAQDLLDLEGMTEELAYSLASLKVSTREDLAELATDELMEVEGMDEERAAKLIMSARAHWFAYEQQG